jgi:F-type H+-transporting ATPase subunit c
MFTLAPNTLLMFITTIVSGAAIVTGTIAATVMEGRAVVAAFENMARQPSVADRISGLLFVTMALLESTAIYVLLVVLILLFANPFVSLIG